MNAQDAIKECYPIEAIDSLLKELSKRVGKPLQNKGVYLPVDGDLKQYMREIAALSSQGYYKFQSQIDGERVVIRGV